MDEYEAIQEEYLAEMEMLRPSIEAWWNELFKGMGKDSDAARPVWKRWPTGPAGHPRVLAVFRKYYLKVDEINDRNIVEFEGFQEPDDVESMWSGDVEEHSLIVKRQVDLLVYDIQEKSPGLFEIVRGIVFIPIGLNQHKDTV